MGDTPEDAGRALAMIEAQQARAVTELDVDLRLLYGTWGLTYLLGFGSFYVSAGADPLLDLPRPVVFVLFFALMATAIVVTGWHGARRLRGVRGQSSVVGAMYGWSWVLGFATLVAVIQGVEGQGVDADVLDLLWPAGSLLVVGLLYTTGGAIWRDPFQFGLGVWVLVVTAVGSLAGLPGIYLVASLGGGGGFLVAAVWFAVRRRTLAPRGGAGCA